MLYKEENTFHFSSFSTKADSGFLSRLSSPDEKRSETDGNSDGDGNDNDQGIEVDIDTDNSAEGMPSYSADLKHSKLILLTVGTALAGHRTDCQESVTVNIRFNYLLKCTSANENVNL